MQRSWFLVLLFAFAGCRTESGASNEMRDEVSGGSVESAGQTGGEVQGPGDPDDLGGLTGGEGSGNCDETPTEIEDAEAKTELGFSVAEVTAFATGTHQAPLVWHEPMAFTREGQVPALVTPESGTTQITMEITPIAGGARYISSAPAATSGDEGGLGIGNLGGGCSDRIEIDVEVALTTDGGAFDETFTTSLQVRTPFQATFSWPFELDELMGALEVSLPDVDNAELKQFSVETRLGPGDFFTGTIGGIVEQNDGQVASAGGIELASWGDNPCESYEVPVSVDAAIDGVSPLDVLAPINDAGPLTMTWADGSQTELTITADSDRPYACLQPDVESARLLLVSTAHATTTDERLELELEVDVFGQLDESNQLTGVSLVFNSYFGKAVPAAEFESAFGISGVDPGDSETITISFGSVYDVTGSEAPEGMLEVIGIVPFDCSTLPPPDENSSPGCPGPTMTTLDSADW